MPSQYSNEQLEAIQNFMFEKRMASENTKKVLRQLERLAKYAHRESKEFIDVDIMSLGAGWWYERTQELAIYYECKESGQILQHFNRMLLRLSFAADREFTAHEVACSLCKRTKDYGHKCWWCGT